MMMYSCVMKYAIAIRKISRAGVTKMGPKKGDHYKQYLYDAAHGLPFIVPRRSLTRMKQNTRDNSNVAEMGIGGNNFK